MMSKDTLAEYANNHSGSRASNGGQQQPKEIPYSPPTGPKSINDPKSPGIHGTNHGCCGTQGKH